MIKGFLIAAGASICVSCAGSLGIASEVKNRIAECGGGYDSEIKLSANLEAQIIKNIEDPTLKAEAGVEDRLKATVFESLGPNVSEENAVAIYNTYVGCLNAIRV